MFRDAAEKNQLLVLIIMDTANIDGKNSILEMKQVLSFTPKVIYFIFDNYIVDNYGQILRKFPISLLHCFERYLIIT